MLASRCMKFAYKHLHRGLHLVLAPEFKNTFIALFLSVISHTNSGVVGVVRVKRITQEIEPFHHHKLHRLVEIVDVISAHALTSSVCRVHKKIWQLIGLGVYICL